MQRTMTFLVLQLCFCLEGQKYDTAILGFHYLHVFSHDYFSDLNMCLPCQPRTNCQQTREKYI